MPPRILLAARLLHHRARPADAAGPGGRGRPVAGSPWASRLRPGASHPGLTHPPSLVGNEEIAPGPAPRAGLGAAHPARGPGPDHPSLERHPHAQCGIERHRQALAALGARGARAQREFRAAERQPGHPAKLPGPAGGEVPAILRVRIDVGAVPLAVGQVGDDGLVEAHLTGREPAAAVDPQGTAHIRAHVERAIDGVAGAAGHECGPARQLHARHVEQQDVGAEPGAEVAQVEVAAGDAGVEAGLERAAEKPDRAAVPHGPDHRRVHAEGGVEPVLPGRVACDVPLGGRRAGGRKGERHDHGARERAGHGVPPSIVARYAWMAVSTAGVWVQCTSCPAPAITVRLARG